MSNTVQKGGLRLYREGPAARLVTAYVPASDGTLLGKGDAVKLVTAGAGAIGAGPSVVGVTRAAAGDPIYGVVQGPLPQMSDGVTSPDLSKTYRPASTQMYILIRPATNLDEYVITDDGTVASGAQSALGIVNIGMNANLVVANASTPTGQSNMQLAGSTLATTATLQLKVVGVVDDAVNDPTSNNCNWIVRINNAQIGSSGTGVAGV